MNTIREENKPLPVRSIYGVVVCGGGPAGIAAAIFAARSGARVCLIEHQGFLGGVWTAGLLSYIPDAKEKPGLTLEIREALRNADALHEKRDLYDAETMKRILDLMCEEASVDVHLYARLASVINKSETITHVVLEAKEGRFAIACHSFVDTTGDGDLGAFAGCAYDLGRIGDSAQQPMTLLALVSGIPEEVRRAPFHSKMSASCINKDQFYSMLLQAGCTPSYTKPSLFPLSNGLCCMMANHEYGVSGLDSRDLTRASIHARKDIQRVIEAMKRFPGEGWSKIKLVATAPYIGVREGRRIRRRYKIQVEDLLSGVRHANAVTRVTFPIDVHSLFKDDGGGYSAEGIDVSTKPYDIPLRALIAKDVNNLAMAGRCISGDFHAHASYRVTGNAVAMGEAAGALAARWALVKENANRFNADAVLDALETLRGAVAR